jgi:sugar lactone lactonase YvrE
MKNSIVRFSFLVAVVLASVPSDVRASAGDLYSGQLTDKKIDKFTPAGGTPTVFVSGFVADALAFDVLGNLFVADTGRGKIVKVTPGGVATDFATIGKPNGLAFDAAGNLFVSNESTGSIIKLTPTGGSSPLPPGFSGLNGPFGLAFDRNGNLFVSETNTGTISKITPTGTKTMFASGLSSPEGLAFDSAGNLYEVDFSSTPGKVFKFTPNGGKSTFATGLLSPRHIAIDQNDNVFVANFSTQEILKFTPAGGTPMTFASNVNAGGLAFEPSTAQLTNISTRGLVQTGNDVMIGGFIVQGTGPKTVIIRAIGPELIPLGIPNALADPTLELHDSTTALIASNNNWQTTIRGGIITSDQVGAIQNSGHAPTQPSESAIIATLPPGNYTAIVRGVNNTTGVALVEVYDLSTGTTSILSNISTRDLVQTGNDVMIGGFIIGGSGPKTVIVRAIGPELIPLGIRNALADPTLELHDSTTALIASNNNWQTTIRGGIITSDQVSAIQNSGHAPTQPSESAIIATLPPGNYTAIVRGVSNTVGVALVEVYDLSPF